MDHPFYVRVHVTPYTIVMTSTVWFEDGSVVLSAEKREFRVHRSLLSLHSVVFRDMFSIPQRSDLPEGPIELHDDPDDLAHLLHALYDISPYVLSPLSVRATHRASSTFGNNDRHDFRVVSGILRLSTKYILDPLRTLAIDHLSVAWPTALRAWDAREDVPRVQYPSPIDVINLARELNVPSLLPAAFYDLSRFPFAQIFEPPDTHRLCSTSALSNADIQRLALGKEAAQNHITHLIRAMGSIHSCVAVHPRRASFFSATARDVCVSPAACRKDFAELVDLATQHFLFDRERGCTDPLYVAEELGQLKSGGAEFCECRPCAAQLELWAAREREKMWKLVPSWFRLDCTVVTC
jgi:hypothetical protein